MRKVVYVLHEYGAKSHYRALEYLCKTKDTEIVYREFSILKSIIKSIIRFDIKLLKKQFLNILFLLSLIFTKNKKVILGIAPYDFRLLFLSFILRNHKVYYHTSWPYWNRTFYPKKPFANTWFIDFWERDVQSKFIKIFAVSKSTRDDLIKHLSIDENKIVVVNHSFDDTIYSYKEREFNKRKFLYVGKLEPHKGIYEILEYFSNKPELSLTLVGDGSLTDKVKEYSKNYENINYVGFVSDQKKLAQIYNQHDFLLLNSKRTGNWEELFGMVLIEGMACGVIPIASDHTGPKEIIKDGVNGFLFSEKEFINKIENILNSSINFDYIRVNAIKKKKKYSIKEVAKRWEDYVL